MSMLVSSSTVTINSSPEGNPRSTLCCLFAYDDIKDDNVTVKPNLIEAMVLSNLIEEILSSQSFNSKEENEDAIYQATRNNVKNWQKISPVDAEEDKNSGETSGNDSSMISNENETKRIEDSNLVPTPNDTVGDEEEKDAITITSQKTEPTTNAEESFLLTSYNVKKWQFSGGLAATGKIFGGH